MVNAANFWIAWAVYIVAGCLFFVIFWRITRFQKQRGLSYFLRAIMLAIIATPWYVSDTDSVMAPALIIVMMDAITIGGEAAVRASVPLFLAVILALVAALVLMLLRRGRGRKPPAPAGGGGKGRKAAGKSSRQNQAAAEKGGEQRESLS